MSADTEERISAFPRVVRLCSPQQFRDVFSQGRRVSTALFRLHVRLVAVAEDLGDATSGIPPTPKSSHGSSKPPSTASLARLGIAVPKRVASRAVDRNRIRRIVRESFRHQRRQLPQGDYVLLALRGVADASSAALQEGLRSIWLRVNALKLGDFNPTMPTARSKPQGSEPR